MSKKTAWPLRLTKQGVIKATDLMRETGHKSRDVFAQHILEVLVAVKRGEQLPDHMHDAIAAKDAVAAKLSLAGK